MKIKKLNEELQSTSDVDHTDVSSISEGVVGDLLFGNSLAQDLYREFYKEVTDAIRRGDKAAAQSLLDELKSDLAELESENKRWHKTFIDIQKRLISQYQSEIDLLDSAVELETKNEDVDTSVEVDSDEIMDVDIDTEEIDDYDDSLSDRWDDYDDDYDDLDPVAQDRMHAALYGGDRVYCDCGTKRVADEYGYFYCPECDKY